MCVVCVCFQLVGPLAEADVFSTDDFGMLAQFERSSHADAVATAVSSVEVEGLAADDDTSDFRSQLVMQVSSLLRSQPKHRRLAVPQLKDKHRLAFFT